MTFFHRYLRMRGGAERIYDGYAIHILSMREYVLIHIIYSLHLYNEGIHKEKLE